MAWSAEPGRPRMRPSTRAIWLPTSGVFSPTARIADCAFGEANTMVPVRSTRSSPSPTRCADPSPAATGNVPRATISARSSAACRYASSRVPSGRTRTPAYRAMTAIGRLPAGCPGTRTGIASRSSGTVAPASPRCRTTSPEASARSTWGSRPRGTKVATTSNGIRVGTVAGRTCAAATKPPAFQVGRYSTRSEKPRSARMLQSATSAARWETADSDRSARLIPRLCSVATPPG